MNRVYLWGIFFVICLSSCIAERGKIAVTIHNKSFKVPTVSNVKIVNNQIRITGAQLDSVTALRINDLPNDIHLIIESKTSHEIIANTPHDIDLMAGKVFDFLLSSANAAATFSVNFSLCDSTLNGREFDCTITAIDKDVLSYDANLQKWIPRNINGLSYKGVFSAISGLDPGAGSIGDYYIISAPGSIGGISYLVGDWISYNGSLWQKIPNASIVNSVFNRTGVISANKGDYSLNLLSDVDLATTPPVNGDVLTYDGTHWTPLANAASGSPGGVTNVSGTLPISVSNNTTTPLISIATAASGVAGVLSSTAFDTFNNKLGPALLAGRIYLGNASNVATATALSGDISISDTGVVTLNSASVDLGTKVTSTLGIANGGTGATTAAAARSNLGLVIGSGAGDLIAFTTSMSCLPYEKLQISSAPYFMTCVTDDSNTNYAKLSGRSSGQTLYGGVAASENLTLDSTMNAAKGLIILNPNPNSGSVAIGSTSAIGKFDVTGESSITSGDFSQHNFTLNIAPSATTSATFTNASFLTSINNNQIYNATITGVSNKVERTYGNAKYVTVQSNEYSTSNSGNTSSITEVIGTKNDMISQLANATTTNMVGTSNLITGSLGTITNAYGVKNSIFNLGVASPITNSYGSYNIIATVNSAMTNAYGVYSTISTSANITNGYGLYIGTVGSVNKWSIYSSDNNAPAYFAGKVGIGVSSPSSALQIAGILTPEADATRDIGTSALKFKDIYATNNIIQTSDKRLKREIKDSDLGLDFIKKLRPVSYFWKNHIDGKKHYGLIAQETKRQLSNSNNAIVTYDKESDQFGIRYTELISPIIKAIQEVLLKQEILTNENELLKKENTKIQRRLERLEKIALKEMRPQSKIMDEP